MKATTSLLALACLGLMSSVCANAGDWPEIESRGRLRVLAYAYEYPEMFSFDTRAEPGLERELLESFCRSHKVALEVLRMEDFAKEIPMLQRGEADLIIGIVDTVPRRELVSFTGEVFPVRFFVGSHASTPPVTTLAQLRERTVGVVAGSSWVGAAQKAGVPPQRLKLLDNQDVMWEALEAGRIGAVVMPVADLALAMKRHTKVREGFAVGEPMSGAWAVSRTSPLLKQKLDAFLSAARAGNVWSRLVMKYYGQRAVEILKKAKEQPQG